MVIVVKNLMVDKLAHFTKCVKSIEVAGGRFEMTVKRFFLSVLPRGTFCTHRQLCATCIHTIHTIGTVIFRPLISMNHGGGVFKDH